MGPSLATVDGNDEFCVFTHTVMRDILDAKHNRLSFWLGIPHHACPVIYRI
jgi:hypothetical protein